MNSDLLRRLFTAPPPGPLVILLAVLILAAAFDIRSRRIPNWLTLGGVLLGFGVNIAIGPPEAGFLFALEGFLAGFVIYMLLYIVRAMGAGDVKLMAAVGAIVGWERWFGIFLVTAIIGGLLAILLVAFRGRLKRTFFNVSFILSEMRRGRPAYVAREELDVRSGKGVSLPHGAVIAMGTILSLAIASRLGR